MCRKVSIKIFVEVYNLFLYPLLAVLDNSGLGVWLNKSHIPASCYADDLFLLSCNARGLAGLLHIVGEFATNWRLNFVHPDPSKTKSHCIIFGGHTLAQTPSWSLSGQQLKVLSETEHLGITLDSSLKSRCHVTQRIKRAQAAFYGLVPTGLLGTHLPAKDKIFLWRTVVVPTLQFACAIAPLSADDSDRLEMCQSDCIKASLGLPRSAHHGALLIAAGVPRIHQLLRGDAFRTFKSIFRTRHRLAEMYLRNLALLSVSPASLSGSFLYQMFEMCNRDFGSVLSVVLGTIDLEQIRSPRGDDGFIDTLKFLIDNDSSLNRRLLRFLLVRH